jgi:hypothetical protein
MLVDRRRRRFQHSSNAGNFPAAGNVDVDDSYSYVNIAIAIAIVEVDDSYLTDLITDLITDLLYVICHMYMT